MNLHRTQFSTQSGFRQRLKDVATTCRFSLALFAEAMFWRHSPNWRHRQNVAVLAAMKNISVAAALTTHTPPTEVPTSDGAGYQKADQGNNPEPHSAWETGKKRKGEDLRYGLEKRNGQWVVWKNRIAGITIPAEQLFREIEEDIKSRGERASIWCPFCGSNLHGVGSFKGHPCVPTVMQWREDKERTRNSMANVIICDPCGTVTAQRVAGEVEYQANPDQPHKQYALCPDCSEKVYDVLHPQGPRNTPILRGFDPATKEQSIVNQAETTRAALEAEYGEAG